MNSREKVLEALNRAESLADDETAEQKVRMAAGCVSLARDAIDSFLPQESEQLDLLLAQGAMWMASLRSDDAPSIRRQLLFGR